ncbi:MAG: hypothetical protein LH610_11575 [Sphingomonas bacterium]|nr:hypothetical protein [Sphingomonas bacterium]
MIYPKNLTIIVPAFAVVTDPGDNRNFSQRLVFMSAFAILHANQGPDGRITFRERIEFDRTGDQSIDLFKQLGDELEPDTTLAGWRLDFIVGSLIRLPRDSEREAQGKTPLMKLQFALGAEPVDVGWFDNSGGLPTLRQAAARHALAAEWDKTACSNPTLTRQRLSARARTIWAAIADKSLETGDARRKAFASFDQFNSVGGGMK